MLVTSTTIDIEHASVSYGRSFRSAVDPTTVPVRSPDAGPSGPKTVQNPLRTDPNCSTVIVALLVPADTPLNHPTHVPASARADGRVGAVGSP